MLKFLTSFALAFLIVLQAQAAGIQKWVDGDGNVHFGDRPPPGKGESVTVRSHNPGSAPQQPNDELQRMKKQLEANRRDRANKQEAEKQQAVRQARVSEYCSQVRDSLAFFQQGGRLNTIRNGERYYYTEEERQQNISKAKELLAKHCS